MSAAPKSWRFGTVIKSPLPRTLRIMLLTKSNGKVVTTDHYEAPVPANAWIGMTLQRDDMSPELHSGPFGEQGETTWVIVSSVSQWEVLEP